MKKFSNPIRKHSYLLLIVFLACGQGDDRSAADLTMPVVVEKIKTGTIADFISTTGTLQANREETVAAEVNGILRLSQTNGAAFGPGVFVDQKTLLGTLFNPSYLLDVRVESQKLAYENATRDLEKQEVLFKEGGITETELEIARKNALDARLNFESAELRAEKINLRAPISGYITNLHSNFDGTRVTTGFQLCKIMDYAKVITRINLPNSELGKIREGQKANIENYALADQMFSGRVMAIDPTIDPQTRTFSATVTIDNKELILRPGMFVKVDIIVTEHDDAVLIPKEAMQQRDGKPVAFVVEGVSAQLRELSTGIEGKEEIEVTAGLVEGERLVVRGQETLRDKTKVRVTE